MDAVANVFVRSGLTRSVVPFATGLAVGGIFFQLGNRRWGGQHKSRTQKRKVHGYTLDQELAQTLKAGNESALAYQKKKGGKLYCTRIALTGGPCAGKSSSMESLREMLTKEGYDVYFAPEVPTIMMNGGCRYPGIEGKEALMEFEEGLINLQLQVERTFTQVARSTGHPSVIIMDRGLMDIKAYLPEALWNELLERLKLTESYLLGRYDLCLHLVTAAHGAEQFYTLEQAEGVSVRSESPQQARDLDDKMKQCWGRHPNHAVVGNDGQSFQDKLDKVNKAVLKTVQSLTRADLAASLLAEQLQGKATLQTFQLFDEDGNGYIDANELQEAVKTFGMEVTLLEAEMLIKELTGGQAHSLDHQHHRGAEGRLDFEQFQAAVKRLGAEHQVLTN